VAEAGLRVEGLSRSFGPLKALRGVSLQVGPGQLFGLVGPDGAGKTTCLRLLAGVLNPDQGRGRVLGAEFPAAIDSVKDLIGYMPQRFGLYADLSVLENLSFYADIHRLPRREKRPRLEEMLVFVGLADFLDRRAGQLSGGMKQKLGLACALVHRPRLLLLDEPTSGVDPISRREFWTLLVGLLGQGVSILVATTYLDEAERCHRVAFLHRGELLRTADPESLKGQVAGRLIELEASPPEEALRALGRLEGVAWSHRFGLGLHALLRQGLEPARLREALTRAGVELIRLEEISPSLEDAYIDSLGQDEEGGWV